MRFSPVKSIASFLIAAGVASAQGPATGMAREPAPGKLTSSVTSPAAIPPGTFSTQSPLTSTPADDACTETWSNGWTGYRPYTFYASGEFMLLNLRDFHIPPLASNLAVGLISVPNVVNGGSFSLPVSVANNPQVGGNPINFGDQTGARFTGGVWLDEEQDFGLEASFFWIGRNTENFAATTANTTNQFNVRTGIPLFLVAGGPPVANIEFVVPRQTTANLFGSAYSELCAGDANVRSVIGVYGPVTFTGLSGVRHIRFNEGLTVNNSVILSRSPTFPNDTAMGFPAEITFTTLDTIRTKNEIYAAQAGIEMDMEFWGLFLNMKGRVAIGGNRQTVDVLGVTNSTRSDGQTTLTNAAGGLLSGPIDQGTHRRTRISIIPEINVKLGYAFSDNFRGYVGYDGMYMHHVARPDAQTTTTTINTQVTVNQSQNTVSVSQPTFRFRDLDVWAAGINFGFEVRY